MLIFSSQQCLFFYKRFIFQFWLQPGITETGAKYVKQGELKTYRTMTRYIISTATSKFLQDFYQKSRNR